MTSSPHSAEGIIDIYSRQVDTVYRVCFTFMKSKPDAEDMVQKTFFRIISGRMSFQSKKHERAWLIATASGLCKDGLHRTRQKDAHIDKLPAIAQNAPGRNLVLDAVLALPADQKTVVYMYYYEGYSIVEIADIMGCRNGTVRSRLTKARQALRKNLGEWCPRTRQTLQDAYSCVNPNPEQKEKMLQSILAQKTSHSGQSRPKKLSGNFRASMPVVCLSLTIALATVIWIGGNRILRNRTINDAALASLPENLTSADSANESAGARTDNTAETETTALNADANSAKNLYQPVLEKYVTAIQTGMTLSECANADISILTGYLTDLNQLGWWITDLDGNGTQELIISNGDVIYDLYTVENSCIIHVFTGMERNSYCLCENNLLKNSSSNGAASSIYCIYRLVGSNMVQEQAVTYDGMKDPDNGWFIGFEKVPASYEEAQAVLAEYREVAIPQTLFSEWL